MIELMGKGRKARDNYLQTNYINKGHQHYHNSKLTGSPSAPVAYTPKLADMLQTASHKTQAIFKISSFGKEEQKIAAHLSYISRRAKLVLEDQDGNKITSLEEQRSVLKFWSNDFEDSERSRDTMHLVLSTPPGTNRSKALQAAREFLTSEYKAGGHEYLFVAHEDTDHPHIHAVIKMVSSYGTKLNPRKVYLNRVRQEYAKICRSYDIAVEASSRAERGLAGVSQRSEFVQMKRSGRLPNVDLALIKKVKAERHLTNITSHMEKEKLLRRNQIIRKRYADKARQVVQKAKTLTDKTEQAKYNKAAKLLDNYARNLPVTMTRSEKVQMQLDAKLNNLRHQNVINRHNPLEQYEAVTEGEKNEHGFYISSQHAICERISNIIFEKQIPTQQQDNSEELELELER